MGENYIIQQQLEGYPLRVSLACMYVSYLFAVFFVVYLTELLFSLGGMVVLTFFG